jgi:hypothetical protein
LLLDQRKKLLNFLGYFLLLKLYRYSDFSNNFTVLKIENIKLVNLDKNSNLGYTLYYMISFLNYSNFDLVLEYLSPDNLLEILLRQKKIEFTKIKLSSWSQVFELCNIDEDIFGNQINKGLLLDFEDLKLWQIEELSKLKTDKQIYLYSSSLEDIFTAETKKTIKKHFELVELKKNNPNTEKEIFENYAKTLNLNFKNSNTVNSILAQGFASYLEIINILDFCSVSKDLDIALSSFLVESQKPLFMESFDILKPKLSSQKWNKLIKNDTELQLAISLLFGKIAKQKNCQEYLKKIILLDQDLKTKSGSQILWWKLYLWQNYQNKIS